MLPTAILSYRNKVGILPEKGLTHSLEDVVAAGRIAITINIFDLVPNSRDVYANNFRFTEIILISSNTIDSFVE